MTTQTKITHTPGPWYLKPVKMYAYNEQVEFLDVYAVGQIRESPICGVFTFAGDERAESQANARLIADAPRIKEEHVRCWKP